MKSIRTLLLLFLLLNLSVDIFNTWSIVYSESKASDKPEIFVQLGHSLGITSVAFSPDGKYALSGSKDHTLRLWEVTTGKEIRVFKGHSKRVNSIAFGPDGQYALSASSDNTLKLWEVATGKEIRTFKGHSKWVNEAAFSPDGKYALSGSGDNTLKLWEIATGKEIRTFKGHSDGVESVAFSPDGKYALSGSGRPLDSKGDNTLRLWEIATGKEIRAFKGHSKGIPSIAFSPDGKYALSGSWDDTLKLWEIATGKEIRTLKGNSPVTFSPDGKYALSRGSEYTSSGRYFATLNLWEMATGRKVRTFKTNSDCVNSIAFSPDGQYVLSDIRKTLKLWEVATGKEVRTFKGHSNPVVSVNFSPDGQYALSGTGDKTSKLWGMATGKEIRTFKGHSETITSVAFSPDGKYALSGSGDDTLKLWEITTGKEIRTFKGHSSKQVVWSVASVAFSRDGKYALSGSGDKTLKLWEVATGEEIRTFEGHSKDVTSVAFSPDGKYALSGSGDKTLKLWEIATGKEIRTFKTWKGHFGWIFSVAFSPDGKYALSGSGDRNLKLWELATGEDIRTFRGHSHDVHSVVFSPDGKHALSGSEDHTIKFWDIATGKEIRTFRGHSGSVNSITFSSDGKYALSGSSDSTMRLWDLPAGKAGVATGEATAESRPKRDREIIQMISFSDGEWICITPEGYFNASAKGAKYLNVRIDNKIYSIDQFYAQFYRPELVQLALAGKELPKVETFGDIASKKPAPSVQILSPQTGSMIKKKSIDLKLQITDNGGGIGDINIYLNGSQVANNTRGIAVKGKELPDQKVLSFNIPLLTGENQIKAIAFNQDGSMESSPVKISISSKIVLQKPNLHAIVVGINEYKNKSISLKYAVSDARAFAEVLKNVVKPLFENVNIILLTSFEETTKESIKNTFEKIRDKVKPNDLFIFYNASHGTIDVFEGVGQYFLLTSNILLLSTRHIGKDALSQRELVQLIGAIPAQKKLIILDTCHAGKAGTEITVALLQQTRGLTDSTAIKLLQRASGSAVFSASSGTQQALEGYKGHGLFTYILINGLKGAADMDKDRFIKIYELADYVEEKVIILSEEVFKRQQTPIIQIGANFPVGKVD